jgi:hypothetical protein
VRRLFAEVRANRRSFVARVPTVSYARSVLVLSSRQRKWLCSLGVITAAIVIPVGYLGVSGLRNEARLRQSGQTTCAEVTERQIIHGRRVEYQVKYRFQIGGVAFRGSDETGRADLWASVPLQEWNRSLAAGCVDVVYLADDPTVSRPARAEATNDPVGNKIAAMFLYALALALFAAAARGITKAARTRVWQLVGVDADGWEVVCDEERRWIRPGDVRRARLVMLPRALVHPPWRFETDVLNLLMKEGNAVVIAAPESSALGHVLEQLQARGVLKKTRAQ